MGVTKPEREAYVGATRSKKKQPSGCFEIDTHHLVITSTMYWISLSLTRNRTSTLLPSFALYSA